MTPTYKTPAVNNFINKVFGVNREKAIKQNVCAICGQPAKKFDNAISAHEFSVSGLCQKCQNKVFDTK